MNKRITKIILTLLIILTTLTCVTITSFGKSYEMETISNKIIDGSFLEMNIKTNDQIASPYCNAVGSYCIEDVGGGTGNGNVVSIIDLKEDDTVDVNNTNISLDNSQINILKAMAYYAEQSVKRKEEAADSGISIGDYENSTSPKYRLSIIARVYIINNSEFNTVGLGGYLGNYDYWANTVARKFIQEAKIENKNYKARFIPLRVGSGQNQIIFAAEEETERYGNLKIHKVDGDNGTNLSDVKFIIKNNNKDRYLQKQGDKINWVVEKNATTFTTNNSGEIYIENIPVGEYTIKETNNTNYGYSNENSYSKDATVKANQTETVNATNFKVTGNLFINKKDVDTNEALEGVEFTIKATKKNYINTNYSGKTEDGDIDYIEGDKYLKIKTATEGNRKSYKGTVHITDMDFTEDESEATRFVTDSDGKIKIYNILKGYYDVEEVSVGNNWQYGVDDNYIYWDFHTYHHVDYYTITPDQREILNFFGFRGYEDNDKTKEEINPGISKDKEKIAHIRVTRRSSENTPTSGEAQYESDKTYEELIFKNRKKYVKISGYAFEDDIKSKDDSRDNLYAEGANSSDRKLEEIKVVLHIIEDGEDKAIQVKRTNSNGEYIFDSYEEDDETKKIEIEKLKNMYVEFVYNGMGYEVTKIVENPENIRNNSTHVVENETKTGKLTRDQFNDKYATIENNKAKGIDNVETNLYYNKQDNISRLKYTNTWNGEGKPPASDINLYDNFIMTANTDDVHESKTYDGKPYILGLRITEEDIRKKTGENKDKIENINLGLYEREQPDIAIMKDLHDIKMTINGKAHVYEYSQRFLNAGEYGGEGFNVGVKFGEKYGSMSYSRPVYQEDSSYEAADKSKELKVYVTYQISMKNQSTGLKAKVNSIIDYYDSKYNLIKVGTGAREGNITGDMTLPESSSYNEKYKKAVINLDKVMEPQEVNNIYVQFELNREAVLNILNDKENLDNVVEINSYSIYDENRKVYAGIDNDSNPGNAIPEDANKRDKPSFEDDTDSAPGLKLEVSEHSREIAGKVFLDGTDAKLMTGEERKENGEYDNGEKGIPGVKIILKENSGSNQIYYPEDENKKIVTTNEEGEFKIKEFIPGDYTLIYVWGDKEYTVENYKGTIWTEDNKNEKTANGDNWYKANVDKRYSDAKDVWRKREIIDTKTKLTDIKSISANELVSSIDNTATINTDYMEETKALTNIIVKEIGDVNSDTKIDEKDVEVLKKYLTGENPSLTAIQLKNADIDQDGTQTLMDLYYLQRYLEQMESITNDMNIGIERTSTTTTTFEDKVIPRGYHVENVDFGIVKRPIQALDLNKRVKNVKIVLAKGQTIVDFNVVYDEETGTYKYEEVKGITYIPPSNDTPKSGLIRAELDSELLQGATLYVTYAIKVKNTSEIDYNSQNYYWYGKLADGENEEECIVKLKPEKIYDYLDQGFEFNENDNLYEENQKAWKLIKEENYDVSNYTFIEEAYSEYREDNIDAEGNRIEREGYENYRSEYEEIFNNWKNEDLEITKYKSKAREYKLDSRNILELNIELRNLEPGEEIGIQDLKVSKSLSNSDEIDLNNDSEITKISRNQDIGSKLIPSNSVIYNKGEDIRITPPTGKTDNNIEFILIIVSSLVILGTGIVFIKKKVIG